MINEVMPRKTLALISGLVIVTVVLFIVALRANNQQMQNNTTNNTANQLSPTASPAHSVLMLSPNPVTVLSGQQGTVTVAIDTSDNNVTAVQLELGYDPTVITNVHVTSGPFFQSPVVLINKNNVQTGRYTYAFGIQPNQPTVKGTGTVATITFFAGGSLGKQSQLALLPTTLVTARGIASSVLKSATGTLVVVGSTTPQNVPPVNAVTNPPSRQGY